MRGRFGQHAPATNLIKAVAQLFHAPVTVDISRRCFQSGKYAPTDVGGYILSANRARYGLSELALLWLLASGFTGWGAPVIESDICVYGATSGGVVAAVAAARLGKNVVLVACNNHVGGMSSGGLGVTDRGNTSSIGGIAAEFYRRVGQAYGSVNPVYWFEPHVAEQTFWQMLNEAGVPVYTNQLLAATAMSGQTITQITMIDGTIYRAKEFIDTTYEGDLMAQAGVTFTVGREATTNYNESMAGIQKPGGSYNYDPYVVAGNTNSGLLPFVQPGGPGTVGQGDNKVQTYNFRLCLTQNTTNRIPIAAPAGYTEAQYELMRRYIAARVAKNGSVHLNEVIDLQTIIPNGKTDINARDELSTDYIGYNYTYPTNTYAGRQVIRQAHEDYIRGLLYFYATSPNVPTNLNAEAQSWGLAKDEFQDTGGWPHQMYVREARRMVSDYVMIQQDAQGTRSAPDPIALASYALDSHPVARLAVGGYARWEGGGIGGTPPYPFGISYRAIIPRAGQCQNLFCTFALSSSHVGFAPVRMEPVFMMTSQSAAIAAAFAIDDNVPVQQVNYQKLSAELRAESQLLTWPTANSSTNGLIVDNADPSVVITGTWNVGANAGFWGSNYLHDVNSGKGSKSVRFPVTLPTNGTYEVDAWWVPASNRATNAPYDIVHAAGTTRVLVNQVNASGGWFKLLTTNFNSGTGSSVTIRNDNTLIDSSNGYVVADAVRWLPVGTIAPAPPIVEIVASDAAACEFGTNTARFSFVRSGGDTNRPALTVSFTISGTATNGVDYAMLPGNVTLAAGAIATNLIVTPIPDNRPEGDRTVTLTLSPSANYTLTAVSNATVIIRDRPIDAWRLGSFTAAELTDASICGDLVDPDHDGLSNLMEYALGLPPKNPAATNQPCASITTGYLSLTYTRAKAAADVSLVVEQSTDLVNWQLGPAYIQQLSCVDEGLIQRITMQMTAPTAAASVGYLRLRVTRL
jgi:hypothetical protein